MNPYEATSAITEQNADSIRPGRSRIVNVSSVATTAIAMPCVALWTIRIINSLVMSNMGFWMIILMFFSVLAAIPLGLIAMLGGRAIAESNLPFRCVILSAMLAIAFPVTYKAIAFLAINRIEEFWLAYGTLVGITGLIPFILGMLVYCHGQRIITSKLVDDY